MILDGHLPEAAATAAQALRAGQLLGLPTETVYGLAADADNDVAVAAIYTAKGRPASHPLIVHVASAAQAGKFADHVPPFASRLMQAFWPGPLTLILPRKAGRATASAGGQNTIGLRCPSHPVAQAVLRACETLGVDGLAAPSANQFGRVSPTRAAHVQAEFGDALLVLDGGSCDVGIESTIIDCTRGAPVLLRPGGISRSEIETAAGVPLRSRDALASPEPRASGTLASHYAPAAKVRLMDAKALQTALDLLGRDATHIAVYARAALKTASSALILRRMPDDAAETAKQLFAVLREFDAVGVRLIWIETPPDDAAWEGVSDRLQRAAAA